MDIGVAIDAALVRLVMESIEVLARAAGNESLAVIQLVTGRE